MKNLVNRFVTSLLLGVLTLGPAAHAQRTGRIIKVDIPFDFTLGREIFPAGQYSLLRPEPEVLELRDSKGRTLASVLTRSIQISTQPALPKLLFDSQGGRHVLTQVWQQDESVGQQILQPNSSIRAVRRHSGDVQTAEAGTQR